MSQSSDAILAYGFPLSKEADFPWDIYEDFETWLAVANGLQEPTAEYTESSKPLFQAYWKEKQELVKSCPVDLQRHCSDSYPMYFFGSKKHHNYCKSRISSKVKNKCFRGAVWAVQGVL